MGDADEPGNGGRDVNDTRGARDGGSPAPAARGDDEATGGFRRWVSRPEVLVGLSALVLSLCGLFISIYETKLVREEQRASVWPHVGVGVSVNEARVLVHVSNSGVGPARIGAAAISYEGETLGGWRDLLRRVAGGEVELEGRMLNLINGAVLAPNSGEEIFAIEEDDVVSPPGLLGSLREAFLDGSADVTTCYCSVYDECWTSSLQDVLRRRRNDADPAPTVSSRVESCRDAERSGI